MTDRWPSVGVVIPTRDRPHLLRQALAAVADQDYPGLLRTVVVFDRTDPDPDFATGGTRPVTVATNLRTPGLAGTRNTGILALDTDLIAFCDDDDEWLPGKLTAQVRALDQRPRAELASCGIVVRFGANESVRLAGRSEVSLTDLLRSRMAMLHSSTFLARRPNLLDGVGLLDEEIPGSQNEDYDLLLRAARRHPIVCVDRPLVRVHWGRTSYFAQQWETKISSLEWMLERHPELTQDPVGSARIYGQLAFAHACSRHRAKALRWCGRALSANWREPRTLLAGVVVSGVVHGDTVLSWLHRHGHGV